MGPITVTLQIHELQDPALEEASTLQMGLLRPAPATFRTSVLWQTAQVEFTRQHEYQRVSIGLGFKSH